MGADIANLNDISVFFELTIYFAIKFWIVKNKQEFTIAPHGPRTHMSAFLKAQKFEFFEG